MPVHGVCQMQARRREQHVVWQDPEPVAYVQRGEEGCEAGGQIEVGQQIVQDLR